MCASSAVRRWWQATARSSPATISSTPAACARGSSANRPAPHAAWTCSGLPHLLHLPLHLLHLLLKVRLSSNNSSSPWHRCYQASRPCSHLRLLPRPRPLPRLPRPQPQVIWFTSTHISLKQKRDWVWHKLRHAALLDAQPQVI